MKKIKGELILIIKRLSPIVLLIIIIPLLLNSCILDNKNTLEDQKILKNKIQPNSLTGTQIEKKITKEEQKKLDIKEKKQKIDTIKKKLAIKWLILKWKINLKNKDYTSALVRYLQIHREIPNDQSVINSLWEVYNNLGKFKQSYSYFSKIKDYKKLNKDLVAKTLISSVELTDENIEYVIKELNTLWLSEQQLFYYTNSVKCKQWFSQCKQNFQDYFNEKINNWSGEVIREITYNDLNDIKTALKNYDNFKIDDLSYKWALISWEFFKNWLYPIAIETSKDILKDKKDYRPLLKIVAKSYYELWNYIEAKIYLIKYNTIVENDYETSYFLWRVYEKLHEYVLSNIHLQKALKIWYPDSLEINKRILLNYYELWEIDKMLNIFKKIIDENKDEIDANDYELAIYYHILNNKLEWAKEITNKALKEYPNSEIFNGYMWWILMEQNETFYPKAKEYINKWLSINTKSPMVNLVKWKLELKLWDTDKAFIYFKKTISLDQKWDYWKIARTEVEKIKKDK